MAFCGRVGMRGGGGAGWMAFCGRAGREEGAKGEWWGRGGCGGVGGERDGVPGGDGAGNWAGAGGRVRWERRWGWGRLLPWINKRVWELLSKASIPGSRLKKLLRFKMLTLF